MEPAQTVPDLVAEAARRWPDAPAVSDGGGRVTFGELHQLAAETAGGLASLGVAPGTAVAIWAPNSLEWIVAGLGAAGAGAVLVPVNTRARAPEVADLLVRSRARVLVTVGRFLDTDYLATVREMRPGLPDLETVIVLDSDEPGEGLPWSEVFERGARFRYWHRALPSDVSHVQFTSGATGRPKGAMLRHGSLCRTTRVWCDIVGLGAGDRYLLVSPMFHVSGYKTGILAGLTAGAELFPQAVFDPAEVLERIERDRIGVLPGPPTVYQALIEHPDRPYRDLSSLRLAVTGAASIPPSLIGRMRRELGFETVVTAYGTTEATGVVTMCRPGDTDRVIASTSGRAVPGVEVRIDEATGEVLVRGDTLMAGYLDDDEATAAAIDRDGWLHTGDVGEIDAEGNLRITDRIADVFQVGGFKTSPAEIEAVLVTHPAVAQAGVVGVADERLGEVGHAFVTLRPGCRLAPGELIAWARDRMANTKVPRHVSVVDELPLNAAGKVHKPTLRQWARTGARSPGPADVGASEPAPAGIGTAEEGREDE